MPTYLTDLLFWEELWPVVAAPLLLSAILALWNDGHSTYVERFMPLSAVSTLGMVVGHMTGLSRTAIVGEVIPAFLTLIGGLLIYLVGFHGLKKQQMAALNVMIMVVMIQVGTGWGSHARIEFEDRRALKAVDLERQKASLRKLWKLPPQSAAGEKETQPP